MRGPMSDLSDLGWLRRQASSFSIAYNAHQDAETTIARHLLHRERLGERLDFAQPGGRAICEQGDDLWELTIRTKDGATLNFVGASCHLCLGAARARLSSNEVPHLAA